jgi:2-C-methyl-D-erythritol 4-phosphate cytidylyltransferase
MAHQALATSTSTRSLAYLSHLPSASAQVAVALLEQRQPTLAQVVLEVEQLVVVVAEAATRHQQVLCAALAVLAATAFFWSTKSSPYEQSLRHPWRHRPQHHRP